jgi:hypothetical protein
LKSLILNPYTNLNKLFKRGIKKMKRLVSTLTLAAVLSLGTSQTFAGVVVSSGIGQPTQCQTGVVSSLAGVVVSSLTGVVVSSLTGILMSDFASTNTCSDQSTGVVVSS